MSTKYVNTSYLLAGHSKLQHHVKETRIFNFVQIYCMVPN